MSKCKFRAADGECLRERAFPYKEFCVDGPCPHYTAKTNADRIVSKTPEELARWMWAVQSGIKHEDIVSTGGWLDWLKEEATDDP